MTCLRSSCFSAWVSVLCVPLCNYEVCAEQWLTQTYKGCGTQRGTIIVPRHLEAPKRNAPFLLPKQRQIAVQSVREVTTMQMAHMSVFQPLTLIFNLSPFFGLIAFLWIFFSPWLFLFFSCSLPFQLFSQQHPVCNRLHSVLTSPLAPPPPGHSNAYRQTNRQAEFNNVFKLLLRCAQKQSFGGTSKMCPQFQVGVGVESVPELSEAWKKKLA